jgi:hypothetical protein
MTGFYIVCLYCFGFGFGFGFDFGFGFGFGFDLVSLPCDLMLTLRIAQCYYEAFLDRYVFSVKMKGSGFLPKPEEWHRIPPTWMDDYYRHRLVQVRRMEEFYSLFFLYLLWILQLC